jgi:hypothetical protein
MTLDYDWRGYSHSDLEERFLDEMSMKSALDSVKQKIGKEKWEGLSLGKQHELLSEERGKRISKCARQAELEDRVRKLEHTLERNACIKYRVLTIGLFVGILGWYIYTSDDNSLLGKVKSYWLNLPNNTTERMRE